jgi:hypothetical protein
MRKYRFSEGFGAALVIIAIIIIAGIFAYQPISDHFTLAGASPTMKSLAHEAGMSHKGELIFLRTDPQLVSSSELATDCNENNSGGMIEQGCFVVDGSGKHIYLRKMASDLHAVEIVTAAHEMLHAAYANLGQSAKNRVDKKLNKQYQSLNNKSLRARMAEYAKTEPGEKDNELHSILGTEFSPLSASLETYYSQYFTDRGKVVAANKSTDQKFQKFKNLISNKKSSISQDEAKAASLYQKSVAAARNGNQNRDNYYYSRYRQEVNLINKLIDKYNQLIRQYNALAAEYNGTPRSSLPNYRGHGG